MFIHFNSKINYGCISTSRLNQLWMCAVDVSKLGSGEPSSAPIWLPYQDVADGSLTPYWTETLPCTVDAQGGCAGCMGEERCMQDTLTNECHCETIRQ